MAETLERLLQFHGDNSKVIVWAHNTHIGDARATGMSKVGMVNIGELAREEYDENNVYLAGFATYRGTVIAGAEWGAPMEVMEVPAAQKGSVEYKLHHQSDEDRYILFNDEIPEEYFEKMGHRAIGVVYDPAIEKYGNYVPSLLPQRYDALIFIDETKALHPLALHADRRKVPETFPSDF